MVPRIDTVLGCRSAINAPIQEDKPMRSAVKPVLVAGGRPVRLLEWTGGVAGAGRPGTVFAPDSPALYVRGAERPGRVHESVGSARHTVQGRQDPHRAEQASLPVIIRQKDEVRLA